MDVVKELAKYGAKVDVYDPWVDADEAEHEYGIAARQTAADRRVRCGRDGRRHTSSSATWASIRSVRLAKREHVLYDIKYLFAADEVDGRL